MTQPYPSPPYQSQPYQSTTVAVLPAQLQPLMVYYVQHADGTQDVWITDANGALIGQRLALIPGPASDAATISAMQGALAQAQAARDASVANAGRLPIWFTATADGIQTITVPAGAVVAALYINGSFEQLDGVAVAQGLATLSASYGIASGDVIALQVIST